MRNRRAATPCLRIAFLLALELLLVTAPARSAESRHLDAAEVGRAEPSAGSRLPTKLSASTLKIEILLDRAHFSPGQIDGRSGENVEKALTAFAKAHDLDWNGRWTPQLWSALADNAPADLLTEYTTTKDDLKGPPSCRRRWRT